MKDPRGTYAIVKVVRVDDFPNIDPDFPHKYKWIVQRIDAAAYEAELEAEEKLAHTVAQLEMRAKRKQLIATFEEEFAAAPDVLEEFHQLLGLEAPKKIQREVVEESCGK